MQQRQPRLGDILDDYCPRERRVTNHVVVAMVGEDVKQTRCTTCDADHEYKHARVPRQRRKGAPAALQSASAAAGAPKRIVHEPGQEPGSPGASEPASNGAGLAPPQDADAPPTGSGAAPTAGDQQETASLATDPAATPTLDDREPESDLSEEGPQPEEGPAHRRLIRATLPRIEGQAPARPGPDFTIRQPNSRQRFRNPRGLSFHHNRPGNGGGDQMSRQGGRRPPAVSRQATRHGPPHGGRKRSK
jgi:hypothetical protein